MATYGGLRDNILKESEQKFGFPFDNRSRIKMCNCLSGPCVLEFEERIIAWFKNRAATLSVCAVKGHRFQTVQRCSRCGLLARETGQDQVPSSDDL